MNSQVHRPTPGKPVIPIDSHHLNRRGPVPGVACHGIVRPVVGPHTPLLSKASGLTPLPFCLKMVERYSNKVVSRTRTTGLPEALAALRLLGPTASQLVLVSGSYAQFLGRATTLAEPMVTRNDTSSVFE